MRMVVKSNELFFILCVREKSLTLQLAKKNLHIILSISTSWDGSFVCCDLMVDYSKWNHFNVEDSDSETEIGCNSQATVTTLEPNSRVQIGPEGAVINSSHTDEKNLQTLPKSISEKNSASLAPNENMFEFETKCKTYSWQQTRYDVSLSINISSINEYKTLEAKGLKLTYALQCINKHFLFKCNGKTLMDAVLAYDIIEIDDDGDSCIDWEVKTVTRSEGVIKLCIVTLRKKSPIPNAIQWWSKVFLHEQDTVDVTKISDRNKSLANSNTTSFNTVWKEAHAQFKANVAAQEKVVV